MKVLLLGYTGLGNFVLKTPFLQKLKELYPDSEIHLLTGNSYGVEHVLGDHSIVTKNYILKNSESRSHKLHFFRSVLRNEKYDIAFSPFDSTYPTLIVGLALAGVKTIFVHEDIQRTTLSFKPWLLYNIIARLFPVKLKLVPVIHGRHEIDLNMDLLVALHDKPFQYERNTFLSEPKGYGALERFGLKPKEYIVLQLGASNGMKTPKIWARENFESIVGRLRDFPYKVVTVGDQGDFELYVQPLLARYPEVINTAGLTSIDDVKRLLANARAVVAHDSGIMHIANALNVPLLALYGPTDYTRTQPLGIRSRVLMSHNDSHALMYKFKESESSVVDKYGPTYPMSGITVDAVWQELINILEVEHDSCT